MTCRQAYQIPCFRLAKRGGVASSTVGNRPLGTIAIADHCGRIGRDRERQHHGWDLTADVLGGVLYPQR
ncbi:MAG: hypothetical protein ACK6DC_02065 [Planctomycetota bacterium]